MEARFRCADGGWRGRYVASGRVTDLSLGGAFLRTSAALPAGTAVRIAMILPGGGTLETSGSVLYADEEGMAVRFVHDREAIARLHGALASAVGDSAQ